MTNIGSPRISRSASVIMFLPVNPASTRDVLAGKPPTSLEATSEEVAEAEAEAEVGWSVEASTGGACRLAAAARIVASPNVGALNAETTGRRSMLLSSFIESESSCRTDMCGDRVHWKRVGEVRRLTKAGEKYILSLYRFESALSLPLTLICEIRNPIANQFFCKVYKACVPLSVPSAPS